MGPFLEEVAHLTALHPTIITNCSCVRHPLPLPRDGMTGSASAKVREALRDGLRVRQTCLHAFAQERAHGCGQGCAERPRLGRAHVGLPKLSESRSVQVVVTARLLRGQPLPEAG